MRTRLTTPIALALAASLAILPGCTRTILVQSPPEEQAARSTRAEPAGATTPVSYLPSPSFARAKSALSGEATIADIAERALPSVVNIAATKLHRIRSPLIWRFFEGAPRERREQGLGSGVIVSSEGLVLTNNHVIENANEISVTTYDGREFDGEVVGTDPKSDLAVLRLKGKVSELQPIALGDSSRLRLGDVVLAIGNPFGVGQTVTMGIVSAKGRADVGIVDYEDFIQTDAAINPGNSGGALVNMEGELVGINTAILSKTGGSMGIGFAIPSNMVSPIMQSLLEHGRVVRGWLGVYIQDVDQELASAMKLATTSGVLISDVKNGGPAAIAGLRRGDVVTAIDGKPVPSSGVLRNIVALAGAGKTITLSVLREGKPKRLQVRLGEMPGEKQKTARSPQPGRKSQSLNGLTLAPLSRETRRRFHISADVDHGVVITRVERQSFAARAGLRPGDVLLEVNRTKVETAAQFHKLYNASRGTLLLLVHRGGSTVYVVIRRPK